MGAFGGLSLTNKGKILQSKAQTGVNLHYTRIAMGNGELGSTPILALNGLISEKKSLTISKLKVQSDGKATVGTTWSNSDLIEGFYFREIGVFAQDPDVGEILYCYGNSGALAEYIPPGGSSDIIERSLDIITKVGNATNVTATIDSSLVYASVAELQSHITDYVKHPAFAVATGTANTYAVTLNPAPSSYVDGMGIAVAINVDSTGVSTLNVNGLGPIPIKKASGADVTNLKTNGIYTLRYKAGNFILQGEGGEYGTANAPQVLEGYTVGQEEGLIDGTMPNRGAVTNNLNAGGSYTIPEGYHNGSGKITANSLASQTVADAVAANILSGKTAWVNGSKITGAIPSKAAATITPGTSNQTIAANQFLSGIQTILGDADLVAANIISGKSIFNVIGTAQPLRVATGTTSSSNYTLSITGLGFTPKYFLGVYEPSSVYCVMIWDGSIVSAMKTGIGPTSRGSVSVGSDSLTFTQPSTVIGSNQSWRWVVIG